MMDNLHTLLVALAAHSRSVWAVQNGTSQAAQTTDIGTRLCLPHVIGSAHHNLKRQWPLSSANVCCIVFVSIWLSG
jgi:hypothetical protein